MATPAYSIGASAAATPHLALVPSAASPCWTADPRAAKLLASCAALPPVILEHRSRFGNAVDRWTAFAGYRVEALEAIRMEVGERLLQAYHQQGPDAYEPFRDWCEQPNASDAVAAVLASSTEH
ncbi:hypothetical protein QP164_00220 [Sphingomonas sp. LR59]|uniref:hypothetical protein n=1 Tax=Sphingomonas sp. LR59 TaxID=3050232 RepID=UPI002FE20036